MVASGVGSSCHGVGENTLVCTQNKPPTIDRTMLDQLSTFVWADAATRLSSWNGSACCIIVAYVPVIFLLQAWMSQRPAFDLAKPLKYWNGTLSLLSGLGFVTNLGYLREVTFETSYTSVTVQNGPYGAILFLFNLSKFLELADTGFLVLRKKQLFPLHWIHHLTVLIYCWFSIHNVPPTGYWFAQTNMLVHMLMYGYFAVAEQLRSVTWFHPMIVTVLQIAQMVWGLVISALYILHPATIYDVQTLLHLAYAVPMYAAYLYLFCQFFTTKYHFETPVNWSICGYLGMIHVLGVFGVLRCVQYASWGLLLEIVFWYQLSGLGITMGCHRLWSHRSYKARAPTRFLLMLLASVANQGGIYHWSRDHRVHHKESDRDGDPHDIRRGFFYAHMGWLLLEKSEAVKQAGRKIDCSDLLDDPFVWIQHTLNPAWDHFWCFVVPGLYGLWRLGSFWDGLLLFGVLRWVVVLHATWCINSVAHTFGCRPYNARPPTNNLFTALVALGEGWHNFHHAYPFDYATAEHNWWHSVNVSKMMIDFLWLIGQTSDHKRTVMRPTPSKAGTGCPLQPTPPTHCTT